MVRAMKYSLNGVHEHPGDGKGPYNCVVYSCMLMNLQEAHDRLQERVHTAGMRACPDVA